MTAFSQISSVWCVCKSGLRLCAPKAPSATTRKPLTAARRRHQAEVITALLIPSIVGIRHRVDSSAALLWRTPASAGLYYYVPSISVVEVLSKAFGDYA